MTDAPFRFGVCADPHKDLVHDADERLAAFIDEANRRDLGFILQLGDFCRPYPQNRGFMDIWERYPGAKYHTLGNHDMDGGFPREAAAAHWGMPSRFYSFDAGGYHFVVLDGNDLRENRLPGYPRYIAPDQQEWLKADLAAANAPTFVFSHQGLESPGGVENAAEMRALLEAANRAAGWRKAAVCFSGHDHADWRSHLGGIDYLRINSMSYVWLGEPYAHVRYSAAVDRAFPAQKYTVPYRDPLFCFVRLDPDGTLTLEGGSTEYVGPSPWEVGFPVEHRDKIRPAITNRRFRFAEPVSDAESVDANVPAPRRGTCR